MRATITIGVSGSGKSTWAETYAQLHNQLTTTPVTNINRDETRWMLSGKHGWNGPNAYKFNKDIEKHVTLRNRDELIAAKKEGKDVIISDTNLNPHHRKALIELLGAFGYEVEIKEFPISFQEALRRDKARGVFSVGEEVLKRPWESWVKYWQDKGEGMWEAQKEVESA